MVFYLKDTNFLSGSERLFHGFFGRRGGVSKGVYESLNCGPLTKDEPRNIDENRGIVCDAAGVERGKLAGLYQVHGDLCVVVDEAFPLDERPKSDALVTGRPGIALSILSADCAPVLFCGDSNAGPVIGAAHAGWGGALKGVLESTVREMEKLGADRGSIRASVGPCISLDSYEVGETFAGPFLADDPDNRDFFRPAGRQGHLYFDLPGYCRKRLRRAGLDNISVTGVDTYSNAGDYFSHRRATHENAPDSGRQISMIAIR